MKIVIGVGFTIPSTEDDFLEFDSNGSLSDADIAIFDPSFDQLSSYHLDYPESTFRGKDLYNIDSSFKIRDHTSHWTNEINSFLKEGKTVFISLSEKKEFFIHSGKKQTSGTGRNQKVTNLVDDYDNYKFLSPIHYSINNAKGSKIFPYSPLVKNLYECCKDCFEFQAYIQSNNEIKNFLFATKNKDKILGAELKVSNGNIVFIPAMSYPLEFTDKDGEWSPDAVTFGKRLKACLIEISNSLTKNNETTPTPDWANTQSYLLKDSQATKAKIENLKENIVSVQLEIENLENVLHEQELLKNLLFETGKPLELSVIKALKILGFNAENYNDGMLEIDQLIVSPEGDRYIGECEGKDNKDIDISKFRQLLDSLNEDFSREEVQEKAFGILFGNPQRLLKPNDRKLDFTEKCKRASEREKIALIKTADLFTVSKYLIEQNDDTYRIACRKAIKDQLGHIVKFPEVSQ